MGIHLHLSWTNMYGKVLYWVNRYTVVSASHGILLRNKKE